MSVEDPSASPADAAAQPESSIPPPTEHSAATHPVAAPSPPSDLPPAEAAPPPLVPPTAVEQEGHPFIFHGQTDEYFRIWIVNTLLTLLTAGIFLAWAKVRKRRYLRGSLELLGARFDYRADPRRLLIGHGVMVLLFLGYSLFGVVYPAVRYGTIALALVMLPWIVVRSLAFNAHNTVYRGLRFRFNRSLSGAALVYVLEPVFIVLTFGFYFPAWERSKRNYVISNHRLGTSYFRFHGATGPFYVTYFIAGVIFFAAILVGAGFSVGLQRIKAGQLQGFLQLLPFFVTYAVAFFVCRQLIFTQLFNHVWNHTTLDEHRFRARLETNRWLRLQLANVGAIVVSCGLLYPWAVIRSQRYIASCMRFFPRGPIDDIQALGSDTGSATGEMAAEFVGIDFGL